MLDSVFPNSIAGLGLTVFVICSIDFRYSEWSCVRCEGELEDQQRDGASRPKCREAPITSADSLMTVWVQQICRGVPPDDIIATIAARLKTAKGEDRYEWTSRLQLILSIANRDHEALRLLDQVMEEFPDDVLLPMKKATINLYFVHDLEEALKWINVAMERAHRSGSFQREVLGNKARILLKLGRGDELSDVLEEIMSLQIGKDVPDIGRERDFVDRAPPGLIRKNVLDRYNEFRPKRAGDTSADEPPEWEPANDTT